MTDETNPERPGRLSGEETPIHAASESDAPQQFNPFAAPQSRGVAETLTPILKPVPWGTWLLVTVLVESVITVTLILAQSLKLIFNSGSMAFILTFVLWALGAVMAGRRHRWNDAGMLIYVVGLVGWGTMLLTASFAVPFFLSGWVGETVVGYATAAYLLGSLPILLVLYIASRFPIRRPEANQSAESVA